MGREDWYYQRDFSPVIRGRCSAKVAPDDNLKVVHPQLPPDPALDATVFFASSIFYDDEATDPFTIKVALVRVGFCAEAAAVRISTADGTAAAGNKYKPLEDYEVFFDPGESVKWVSIGRLEKEDWTTEQFFTVQITEVVLGKVSIGVLSQCSVVCTDFRKYPGLKTEAALSTFGGQKSFVLAIMKEFANNHGHMTEFKGLLALFYDAVYSTLISNILYTFYFLDVCIGQSDYYGFFVIAAVEACHVGLSRISSWWQAMCGSYGPRGEVHSSAVQRVTSPFFKDSGPDVDNHFMNVHVFSVDSGVGQIYFSALVVYKSAIQVIISVAFIIVSSHVASGSHVLMLYRFVPLMILLPTTMYFGYFWNRMANWKMEIDSETANQDRLEKAMWVLQARKTTKAYGTGYLRTLYDNQFKTSMGKYFDYCYSLFLHEMDASWLTQSFGDILVMALFILLGLLHLESAKFGAGNVTLGMVWSTVGIYRMLHGASCKLCQNCRNIQQGIASINSARDLLDKDTKIPFLAEQLDCRLQHYGLLSQGEDGNRNFDASRIRNLQTMTNLACEFRDVLYSDDIQNLKFSGKVPLGAAYVMSGKVAKNEQDTWFQLMQGVIHPTSGSVLQPSFIRCIGLCGESLPELFHMSAIENALAFADTRRYDEDDARLLLMSLDVFGESTFSLGLSEKQLHDGDPLTGGLEPSWVSLEDRALITLVQAILADPEILMFDTPLLYLPERLHKRVLGALLSWQRGGPRALLNIGKQALSKTAQKKEGNKGMLQRKSTQGFSATAVKEAAKANVAALECVGKESKENISVGEYPAWFQRSTCGIKRTLILNPHTSIDAKLMAKEFGGIDELHMENGKIIVRSNDQKITTETPGSTAPEGQVEKSGSQTRIRLSQENKADATPLNQVVEVCNFQEGLRGL
eukprot:gnl/MRDRNA2_/MRDRNA2_137918_c0_seq1.p1 gnl/MRDRNA2_/MRDRNA2_137918_c0~~gnl/MRDRNA2_/MRDRNA2_137918_c0_seq1.p1  ORF type:complete len:988 (-),score=148.94 gnl/MRDRNA2_/MRDRNA2_137918_c0_seq1:109-2859(-)